MSLKEKIEKICKGRAIRIFSARAERSVTFVESFRNCGKTNCLRCRDRSMKPHGPYWILNYVDDHGKPRSLYIGKKLPELTANKDLKVSFADVVRYYEDSEANREAITKYRREIYRMKREIESLFEELRSYRRTNRKRSSPQADKLFKQLAIKYHPDRNASERFSAEDVMKDLNQLYQKLVHS